MYIGINKLSAIASDDKPLYVFRIQQEAGYICLSYHTILILLNLMFMYHNFNVTSKVSRYTVSTKVSQWKSNEFDKYPAIHQGFPY